jgi:hypothetical protein
MSKSAIMRARVLFISFSFRSFGCLDFRVPINGSGFALCCLFSGSRYKNHILFRHLLKAYNYFVSSYFVLSPGFAEGKDKKLVLKNDIMPDNTPVH